MQQIGRQTSKTPGEFQSELTPDVTLRHFPKLEKLGASKSRYKLIDKGKNIMDLSFTQFQGYGTHMWWHGHPVTDYAKGAERIFFKVITP